MCDQEECPFWTGHACVCDILFMDRQERDFAIQKLGLSSDVTDE